MQIRKKSIDTEDISTTETSSLVQNEIVSEKESSFLADNYVNETMMGQNSYDNSNGCQVDLGSAFEVTIEELEPLYKKVEKIWDKYGVAVLIADKVSSDTGTAEICYDYKKIENSIELVEKCLQCYLKDFFKEFSEEEINTTVCIQLVGTGDAAGVFKDRGEFKIVQIDVNDYCPEEDRAIIFGTAMNYYQGLESMGFNDNIDAKLIYLSDCIKNGFVGIEWSEKPAWEYILDYEGNYLY